jgi:2,4-dienoyl-CoA reductase-like NADH-dependent reductase (Old Yellow Enzyme family)
MSQSRLDEPIRLGSRTARNRLMHLAVNPGLANQHRMSPGLTAYLAARAPHLGVIVSGLTPVHMSSVYKPSVLKNTGDEDLPELAGFAQAIGRGGALSILQLVHNGGQMPPPPDGGLRLTPSGRPAAGFTGRAAAMTRADIGSLIAAFADAADRARRAGLDGVEIHGAHGFLLHQFLSPLTNQRTDEYGGSVAARVRFPREVIDAVRQRVGAELVVGFRLVGDEFATGGITAEDARYTAATLTGDGLLDYVSVTAGNYATLERGISPLTMPDVPLVDLCRGIRAVVDVPVVAANRIRTPQQAQALLADGAADLVGLGRALLADPDWAAKLDRPAAIRPCIGTNACFAGGGVTTSEAIECAVNPRLVVGRETSRSRRTHPNKVLVVGAGVAGLTVALEASRAGLAVRLVDAAATAGGQVSTYDSALTGGRFGEYVEWSLRELDQAGIHPEYGMRVTADSVADSPLVVLATGSQPSPPPPGLSIVDGLSLLHVPPPPGRIVVVAEDDAPVGLQLARFLARAGHRTRLAVAGADPAPGMEGLTKRTHVSDLLAAGGELSLHTGPLSFDGSLDGDVIAWCGRRTPAGPEGLIGPRVYRIGDCATPGSIVDATRSALRLVEQLTAMRPGALT